MDKATEERLSKDWESVWEQVQDAGTHEARRRGTAPIDVTIERLTGRLKDTLNEDQGRLFDTITDLAFRRGTEVQVAGEDLYFRLGYLAASGKLDQVPELLAEYPAKEAERIGTILDEYLQLV